MAERPNNSASKNRHAHARCASRADMDTERFQSLDAMRGIAAVLVMLTHLSPIGLRESSAWSILADSPLRFFWSGHQAVIFFFVLSGFSLYLMQQSMSGRLVVLRFCLARTIRLYPAYITSILLAMLIIGTLKALDQPWPPESIGIPLGNMTTEAFIAHALMIGSFDPNTVNSPIWSLVHEMRISLLFPIIFLIVSRNNWRWMAVPICISLGLSALFIAQRGTYHLIMNAPALLDGLLTVHYATAFFAGAWLAKHRTEVGDWAQKRSQLTVFMLTVIALIAYSYGFHESWTQAYRFLGDLLIGGASALLIVFGIGYPQMLKQRACRHLGKISYSLYLVHMPAIILVVVLCYGHISSWVIIPVTAAAAFILAVLLCRFVDMPSIAAAKVVRRFGQPRQAKSPQHLPVANV